MDDDGKAAVNLRYRCCALYSSEILSRQRQRIVLNSDDIVANMLILLFKLSKECSGVAYVISMLTRSQGNGWNDDWRT